MKRRILSLLLVCCMLLSMFPAQTFATEAASIADEGKCGSNLRWTLTEDGTLTITGYGNMTNYSFSEDAPWADHADDIKRVIVGEGVANIGNHAFRDYDALEEVQLPSANSFYVGDYAFYDCDALQSLYLPPDCDLEVGTHAVSDCDALTWIALPGMTKTDEYAFAVNKSLETVYFNDGAGFGNLKLSGTAFNGVTATVRYPLPVSTWTSLMQDYDGDLTWEAVSYGVCGPRATWSFDETSGVLTVSGTGEVTACTSGRDMPWGGLVNSITSIVVERGITSLDRYAFEHCEQAVSITLPDTLTYLSLSAFNDCGSLTSITLPASLQEVEGDCFIRCESLTNVWYMGTVEEWKALYGRNTVTKSDLSALNFYTLTLHEKVDATCMNDGYEAYYAFDGTGKLFDLNKKSISAPVVITDGKHNFVNYVCTLCAWEEVVDRGNCGMDASWKLTPDGVLTISGMEDVWGYTADVPAPWHAYAEEINTIVVEEGITDIGSYAFADLANVTDLYLPSTLESTGDESFYGHKSLKNIYLADVTAWTGVYCSATRGNPMTMGTLSKNLYVGGELVTDLVLPEEVIEIPASAFACCTSITSVTFEGSVMSIASDAFSSCTALKSVTFNGGLWSIGSTAFYNTGLTSITIPAGVAEIGKRAFWNCSKLCTITFLGDKPTIGDACFEGVNATANYPCDWTGTLSSYEGTIKWVMKHNYEHYICTGCGAVDGVEAGQCGENAYWRLSEDGTLTITGSGETYSMGCSGVTVESVISVVVEEGITSLGENIFSEFPALTSVALPQSLQTIGDRAFTNSTALASVTVPANVTSIGASAFYLCSALQTVKMPAGLQTIGEWAFAYCPALTDIEFPEELTSIGAYAFYNSGIPTVAVPDSVTTLGEFAFAGCGSLTDVTLGSGITALSNGLFYQCDALETITVPANITLVGSEAFNLCFELQTVIFLGDAPQFSEGMLGVFRWVEADVYYPCNADGWDEASANEYMDSTLRWRVGHVKTDAPGTVTAPTCDKDGYTTYTCALCSESFAADFVTPTGHDYVDDICSVCGGYAPIDSGICGYDLTWVLDKSGKLTISGTGEMYVMPDFSRYSSLITSVVIEEGVTSIGSDAFYDFDALVQVSLPESLRAISDNAFSACNALEEIVLPDGLETLGRTAFYECTALHSVNIPTGLTAIGEWVFADCDALTEITIPANITAIGDYAFYDSGLTALDIPDTVTSIGVSALANCRSLEQVTLGAGITVIPADLCYGSSALMDIIIPDTVTTVYAGAFGLCSSLGTVTFLGAAPDFEDEGESGIFNWVTATVYYPCGGDGWTADVLQDYGGTLIWEAEHTYINYICSSCGALDGIAAGQCGDNVYWHLSFDGVLTITGTGAMSDYASASDVPWYDYRSQITAATVESGITRIGHRAFYQCTALTELTIAGTVAEVGNFAIYSCSALEELTIPASVTAMGNSSLRGCENLKTLTMRGNAPTVGSNVLDGMSTELLIYRYEGSTGYGTKPWSGFSYSEMHVGTWITDTYATCTQQGSQHIYCSYCQETFYRTLDYAHDFDENDVCTLCGDVRIVDGGHWGSNNDPVYWKLDAHGTLTVYGVGDSGFCYNMTGVPWHRYRADIKKAVIEDGVTSLAQWVFQDCVNLTDVYLSDTLYSIGKLAFGGCTSLETVVLPESLTNLGEQMFRDCTALQNVTLSENLTKVPDSTFSGCTALQSITIPEGIETIGDYAFSGCIALTEIEIPESVTSIGGYAFFDCTALPTIDLPGGMTAIGEDAFRNCDALTEITIPANVKVINGGTFYECASLVEVTLPGGLTAIGGAAFRDCPALTTVNIPNTVTSIGHMAFSGTALQEVIIPGSVTTVGYEAFECCTSLETLVLGEGVEVLDNYVFNGCTSLQSVTLPSTLKEMGINCFYNCPTLEELHLGSLEMWLSMKDGLSSGFGTYGRPGVKNAYVNGELLTDLVIPEGIETIAPYTFYNWECLQSVTFSEGLVSIGEHAFYRCDNLSGTVVIPDSTETIGTYAFGSCAIEHLALGDGLAEVGSCAFGYCSQLADITVGASAVQYAGDAFTNCGSMTTLYLTDLTAWLRSSGTLPTRIYVTNVGAVEKRMYLNGELLTQVKIPEEITEIPDYAFAYLPDLQKVTLHDQVTSIGQFAFACTGLTAVEIPDSVTSLGYGALAETKLTNVVLPESVTQLEGYIFGNCYYLVSVTLPSSITSITDDFYDCNALHHILFRGTQEQWDAMSRESSYLYPDYDNDLIVHCGAEGDEVSDVAVGCTLLQGYCTICDGYFFGEKRHNPSPYYGRHDWDEDNICTICGIASELTYTLTAPNTVTITGCSGGDDGVLTIPSTLEGFAVKHVGVNACSTVKELIIEEGIETIGEEAFRSCGLKIVHLPASLKSIGEYAFYYNVDSLEQVHLADLEAWLQVDIDYAGSPFNSADLYIDGQKVTELVIPESITEIKTEAFFGITGVERIVLHDGVTVIGSKAFGGNGGTELREVVMSANVTYVGSSAFGNHPNLKEIYFTGNRPEIDPDAFNSCELTLYYPCNDATWNGISNDDFAVSWNNKRISVAKWHGTMITGEPVAPTCLAEGYTPYTCELCGMTERRDIVPAAGHTEVTDPAVDPTCTESGLTAGIHCDVCKKVIIEQEEVPALGHTEVVTPQVDPTCFETGIAAIVNCSTCESYLRGGETLDRRIHVYVGDYCYYCGEARIVASGNCSEDVFWAYTAANKLIIYGTGAMPDYTASSDLPWYTYLKEIQTLHIRPGVTSIGGRTAFGATSLVDVIISDTVTKIGDRAFQNCRLMTEIYIPASVTEVGVSVFRSCDLLEIVTLEGNAPTGGDKYFFTGCAENLTLHVYEGSTGWNQSPWADVPLYRRHVGTWVVDVIPTCTTPGSRHIDCSYCGQTFTESIIRTHQYDEDFLCIHCGKMKEVDSGVWNSYYGSSVRWTLYVNGLLEISGSGTVGWYAETGAFDEAPWFKHRELITEVEVGYGITTLGNKVFAQLTNLSYVSLPNSLKTIGMQVFEQCWALEEITIPDSVTTIDHSAFHAAGLTSVTIPSNVENFGLHIFEACKNLTTAELEYGIETVSKYMFYDCTALQTVTIPDSVYEIERNAFYGCTALQSVAFPESLDTIGKEAFYNCTSLQAIDLPESVTEISEAAFYGSGLVDVTLPESVETIGDWAFAGCGSLISIFIPESVESIGYRAFANCISLRGISLPDSVTSMSNAVFDQCDKLQTVRLPANLTRLPSNTFSGCFELTTVVMPGKITAIGDNAFENCYKLKTVEIPKTVTAIGSYAFANCSELREITLPAGLTKISDYTFWHCEALEKITVPEGVNSIGSYAFSYCIKLAEANLPSTVETIDGYAFECCRRLTEMDLTGELVTIGEYAFYDCEKLTEVIFGENLETIGFYAFADCIALAKADLPASLKTIEDHAFHQCESLTGIVFPEGLETIGSAAFINCRSLKDIILPDSLEALEDNAFSGCTGARVLRLPQGLTEIPEYAFHNCESLPAIRIPENVTEIGESAFGYCSGLMVLYLPASLERVDEVAFSYRFGNSELHVVYGGTEVQWADVYFAPNNEILTPSHYESADCVVESIDTCTLLAAYCGACDGYLCKNNYGNHTPEDWVCTKCGVDLRWNYEVNSSGITVIGYTTNTKESLVYPEIIEGVPVTMVADQPGDDFTVKTVTIPASVRTVEGQAFRWCYGLQKLIFLGEAPEISASAFANCTLTIVYPCNQPGWTEEFKNNLDGNITWKTSHKHMDGSCVYCGKPAVSAPVVSIRNNTTSGKPVVSWDAVEDAVKYEIWRCGTYSGTYTKYYTTTSTSFTNSSVQAGQKYYYKVVAVSETASSTASNIVTVTCDLPQPTGVTLTTNATSGKPVLKWDAVEGAVKYDIYRCGTYSGTYTKYYTTTSTTFTNSSVQAGQKYYYKVVAVAENTAANSAASKIVTIVCDLPQPTGVTITNNATTGKPVVSWNAVDGAVGYEIYRNTTYDGTYTKYYTTTSTTFTNSAVKAGEKYYYKVVAVASNTAANSALSKAVTIVCDCAQPTGVTLTNSASSGKPVLKWDAVDGAKEYAIYRSATYDGTYTKYYTTTSTTFTNSSVKAGQKYYYKVVAVGSSSSANSVASKIVTITADLAQPTGVTIAINATTGKPVVSWNAVDGAVAYEIWRCGTYDGTYTKYYTTTSTTFTNSSVKAGQKYYYKVVAVAENTTANSAASKIVTIVCDCAKVNATISLNSNGKPVVKWNAVDGATSYEVYRSTSQNGTYTLYTTTKYTQFTNSGASAGQQYYYKVRAIVSGNSSATGAFSNIVTIKSK